MKIDPLAALADQARRRETLQTLQTLVLDCDGSDLSALSRMIRKRRKTLNMLDDYRALAEQEFEVGDHVRVVKWHGKPAGVVTHVGERVVAVRLDDGLEARFDARFVQHADRLIKAAQKAHHQARAGG